MNKGKTITDPPAHIKRWIDEQFDNLIHTSDYPFSSRVAYRAGAKTMYQKDQEEKEEQSIEFIEWACERYLTYDNGIWWTKSDDDENKYTTKQIYDLYIESPNH